MKVNFELRDLRLFVSVASSSSFRRAAEQNNISQSALSRRIQALETSFGGRLFERTTRQVTLTPYGREVEVIARRTIHEFEFQFLSISKERNEEPGVVKLSCFHTAAMQFLPEAMRQFAKKFPNIRFRIFEGSAPQALNAVRTGDVELGISFFGLADDDLTYTTLMNDPFIALLPAGHRFEKKESLEWSDLQGEKLVGVNRESSNRILIDSNLSKSGISLDWFYELNQSASCVSIVKKGLGIAVLPRMSVFGADECVAKPLTDPTILRSVVLVERKGHILSSAPLRFRDFLIFEALSETPPTPNAHSARS